MFKFLYNLFKQQPKEEIHEFRLVPDNQGTYYLERYNENSKLYLCVKAYVKDTEEAKKFIEILKRETIYIYTTTEKREF